MSGGSAGWGAGFFTAGGAGFLGLVVPLFATGGAFGPVEAPCPRFAESGVFVTAEPARPPLVGTSFLAAGVVLGPAVPSGLTAAGFFTADPASPAAGFAWDFGAVVAAAGVVPAGFALGVAVVTFG